MSNEKIKGLYKKLYNDFSTSDIKLSEMSHFVSMKGKFYDAEKDFRLLLVGRAVNGWGSLSVTSDNEFASDAEKALSKAFDWIQEENGALVSNYYDEEKKEESKYILNSSPFWNYSEEIYKQKNKRCNSTRWIDYIAWTNLYKVAPPFTNNPDEKTQKIQRDTCVKLLKQEIEYYRPTYILIVTGWDWLNSIKINSFISLFNNTNHIGTNISKGKNKNEIYLEGTATYSYSDGTSAKAIISCRPDFRDKEKYVADIGKAFD